MKWSGLRLSWKVIGIGALALAVLAAGAFGVNQALAQDATPTTPEQPGPFGPGMGPRGGMRGFGPRGGGILADYHDVMLQPVADALGLSVDELNAELAAGKRLWEIAEDKGVEAQTLADAMQAGREAAIAQAVTDGAITQEQADQMLSHQFGGMRGLAPRDGGILADYHDVMLQPVADALGLSVDELNAELAAGKRLWEIAEDKGVEAQTLADAMQAGREAAIAQAVTDGVITQEQADQMLSRQFGGPRGGCPGWNGDQAPAPTDTGTSA